MNTMITDYDMTERAIKSGFKLISSRELIENYTDDLIRNLDIMYSDFMVPDINQKSIWTTLSFLYRQTGCYCQTKRISRLTLKFFAHSSELNHTQLCLVRCLCM